MVGSGSNGRSPITGYEIQKSPATGAPVWTAAATVGNVTTRWRCPRAATSCGCTRAGIPTQWVGGTTFATATVTVLTTSATQNIVLTTTLSGTVTTGAGLPVANATVSAYTLAGVWVVDGYTNASGNYTMALPAGSYKLRVYGAGIPTQWVGGTTFATATVTVLTTSATQNIVLRQHCRAR